MYATRTAQQTATDAVQVGWRLMVLSVSLPYFSLQIFGGRGVTQSGMGSAIEHYHRTVPFDSYVCISCSAYHSVNARFQYSRWRYDTAYSCSSRGKF